MTGYTVHTGSTVKFSSSWDRIFSASSAKKSESKGTKAKNETTEKPLKKGAKTKGAVKSQHVPANAKKAAVKKPSSKRTK